MTKHLKTAVALFATALVVGVLAAGIASAQRSKTFTDVPAGSYYEDAAYWAADAGITTGCDEDKFCPTGTLTRAEMITFLYRYDTYNASHTHPPDHTHEEREVESDPIRVEGPAGTDQECPARGCALDLAGFSLPQNTVLLVGKDIAPGKWSYRNARLSVICAVVLTKDVRKHPNYPGRAYWGNWGNDLRDVTTGIAKTTDGNLRNYRTTNERVGISIDIEPHDYAVIYEGGFSNTASCY